MNLTPINLKDNNLAIQNCVFLPTSLAKDPSKVVNIKVKQQILKCKFSSDIDAGRIGMSKNIRDFLGVDTEEPVVAAPYEASKKQVL